MNLICARRGYGHNDFSQNVSVVLWRYICNVDSTLKESVVLISGSQVDQRVVIVAECKRAVQIEHYVSISVGEKVSL